MSSYPLVIENYVTAEQANKLISLLDPMAKPSPRDGIATALGYRNSAMASRVGITDPVIEGLKPEEETESTKLLTDTFNRVKATFEEVFGASAALSQGLYQNMTVGGKNDLHSDTTDLDGNPLQPDGTPEEMEWSGLLYLNTCGVDYEGGSIVFPNQEVEIFPKTGDLVLFPGDFNHIHMVPQVTSGERKNLVFFYGRPENIGSEKSFYDWQDLPRGDVN